MGYNQIGLFGQDLRIPCWTWFVAKEKLRFFELWRIHVAKLDDLIFNALHILGEMWEVWEARAFGKIKG